MVDDYLTDEDVMNMIQNTVIEPPDWGATWPSGLWDRDEVLNYLNDRQNQFLKQTALQFGIAKITAVTGTYIYDLPDDWINTIRVLWITADGATRELTRSDTWEADHGMPSWSYIEAPPKIFFDGGTPATLRIMPIPGTDGTIQVHYVPMAALLTGDGEGFTVPTEFVHFIRYGALADMFSKIGRAQDGGRADYCAKRFQMGAEVAQLLVKGFA